LHKIFKGTNNAFVFMNVILIHINRQHVSTTNVAFFRMMRTVIFATSLQKFLKVIYAGRSRKRAGLRSLYIVQEHKLLLYKQESAEENKWT
jgi:hypothetical protein